MIFSLMKLENLSFANYLNKTNESLIIVSALAGKGRVLQ